MEDGGPGDPHLRLDGADITQSFRLFVEAVKDRAIFLLDPEGRVSSWNAGAQALKGYSREEIVGRHFSVFYPDKDQEAGKPDRELAVAAAEGFFSEEGWRVRRDGSQFWAGVEITALRDPSGKLIGFGKFTRDLSARRTAAERFGLIEAAPDGIMLVDGEGRVIECNPQMARLFGFRREELIGMTHDALIPASSRAQHRALQAHYLEQPESRPMASPASNVRGLRKDGTEFPVDISLSPLAGPDGQRVIVFVRDASALRMAEERLRRLQAVTAQLSGALDVEAVADVVFSVGLPALGARAGLLALLSRDGEALEIVRAPDLDAEERARWPATMRALGVEPHAITPWPLLPMTAHTPVVEAVRTGTALFLDASREWRSDYVSEVSASLDRQGLSAVACLPLSVAGPRGEPVAIGAMRVSFVDSVALGAEDRAFTLALADQCALALHRAQLYDEARAARRAAEEATRMRDQFLGVVSHELRAPLAALLLWEKVLRDNPEAPETRERALRAIHESATVQSHMVDDLLDVSRAISGKLHVDHAPLSITSVIRRAVDAIAPQAEARGVAVEERLVALDRDVVLGDEMRLLQVMGNLLGNALKFTGRGGRVTIVARPLGAFLEIEVCDTGRGFRPELAAELFEPFNQGDETSTGGHGGLGLGLSIARRLVELHGGSVGARSDGPGRGSCFTVTLPLAPQDAVARPAAVSDGPALHERPLEGVRVLLIDDEEHVRDALERLLGRAGAEVQAAASAQRGWTVLDRFRPDVVVCDVAMPGVSGHDFIRRLRRSAEVAPRALAAIALTGHATSEDREEALAAGFDVHMAKPVNLGRLVATIQRLVRSEPR